MPFTIYNRVLVGSLILLSSCYSSHKSENSRDDEDDDFSVDSGDQSADADDSLDARDSVDLDDSLDARDSVEADDPRNPRDSVDTGDALDKGADGSTLVGTWEGELMFYSSDGSLDSTTPATVEFTDSGIDVFVVGMLIQFRYSIDTDQTPPRIDVELFDPQKSLSSPYVIPAFYKIEDGVLTLGLSFFSEPPQISDVEEQPFPMQFEMVRIP